MVKMLFEKSYDRIGVDGAVGAMSGREGIALYGLGMGWQGGMA